MLTMHMSKHSSIQLFFVTLAFLATRRSFGVPHTLILLSYLTVLFMYMGLFSFENTSVLTIRRTWSILLMTYIGLIGGAYRLWQHIPWLSLHLDAGSLLFAAVVPFILIGHLVDAVTATITLIGFAISAVATLLHMPVLAESFSVFTYLMLFVTILQTTTVAFRKSS